MPEVTSRPLRQTHRVPADLACLVRVGDRDYVGHTRDVAIEGLGIELSESPGPGIIGADVTVRLELPAVGPVGMQGTTVRVTPTDIGILIGVRVTRAGRLRRPVAKGTDESESGPRKKPRRSRAKPKPPRAVTEVRAEFRGFCGIVYEQAMLDATAEPRDDLVEWAERLAGELHITPPGFVATYRDLLMELSRIHQEDKEREPAAAG